MHEERWEENFEEEQVQQTGRVFCLLESYLVSYTLSF